jgi:hypothetical protein
MAVNEDDEAKADPEAQTRRVVAIVVSATFSMIALLVVIGGFVGRFDPTLVDAAFTAFAGAAATVWIYLFHQNKTRGE